jgi:predicted RNA binding protein YcfA (HicA-like mRNA interferase family)
VSRAEKLLARFLARPCPKDFSWDELVTLLRAFGFDEKTGSGGSHRTFINAQGRKLFLAKPHPENVVKTYALKQIQSKLKEYGLLPHENQE